MWNYNPLKIVMAGYEVSPKLQSTERSTSLPSMANPTISPIMGLGDWRRIIVTEETQVGVPLCQ